MSQNVRELVIFSEVVDQLLNDIEEATRASSEGVKRFIEPKGGTLRRATNKRHHLVFGRRGSGKSSLLRKAFSNLSLNRQPTAYVDLETFKGHSYPDVLISVMIESFNEFSKWLDTTAVNPSSNGFWKRAFGSKPERKPINRKEAKVLSAWFKEEIENLNRTLMQAERIDRKETTSDEVEASSQAALSGQFGSGPLQVKPSIGGNERSNDKRQIEDTYTYEKEAYLHRNIQRYRQLVIDMANLSDSDAFLFLDDLYHIRRQDQAKVIDYFHRITKNNRLYLKVGTIRHRTTWYVHGTPPIGVKLGDDADDVDLDISLEQYGIAKEFLGTILQNFFPKSGLHLNSILTDDARDRLVLASGGVARDFLGIFRGSVDIAKQRILEGRIQPRGERVGAEDVNQAAGRYDSTKQEELQYDLGDEEEGGRSDIVQTYENIRFFCTQVAKANILLVDKDNPKEQLELVEELVDLRLLHKIQSNVSISKRQGKKFAAYMLDLSQYTGERKIRDFEMIKFWDREANLRQIKFVYDPNHDYKEKTLSNKLVSKPIVGVDSSEEKKSSMTPLFGEVLDEGK
jgi:hypothetical protein